VGRCGLALLLALLILPRPCQGKLVWLARHFARRHPEVVYFADTGDSVLAITIDDSPDSATTPLILEVLRQHQVHATFFIITEQIPGNEHLLRQMLQEGHELGNHQTRDERSNRMSPDRFSADLRESHQILSQYVQPEWFRPGAGKFNESMLDTLSAYGYRCALGSVYPFDPAIRSAGFARRFILWAAHPGGIIILHDRRSRGERTAAVLGDALPELQRRGYRIGTLSELFPGP
jgi:peptidoglycan/xylan/chitin deacetylase (PgdA/CDA1 family)